MTQQELTQQVGEERFAAFQKAFDVGGRVSARHRLRFLEMARDGYHHVDPEHLRILDQWLVGRVANLNEAVKAARRELKEAVDSLTGPPFIPAVYLGEVDGRAWVAIEGRGQRLVAPHEVELSELEPGAGVYLAHECNVLLGLMPSDSKGHIGRFERTAADGQAIVSHRGEEVLCKAVNGLQTRALAPGDAILIDPSNRLAFERLEELTERLPFEVEDVPDLGREAIAGLDEQADLLFETLELKMDRDLSSRFAGEEEKLDGILLVGPPGVGKTRLTKMAASLVMKNSGCRMRFISIRPAEFKDPYVGRTESNIRNCFKAIRQVSNSSGDNEHIILFLDEVESFGRRRGTSGSHSFVDDFTNALLAEIDGFESLRGVTLVAATNRKDLLDHAFLERIGGLTIEVPRPNLAAARAILGIHLPDHLPWENEEVRSEAIEAAAASLYLGERTDIARITFNDSSTRTVQARELVSGRLLASIATNARRLAARRCKAAGTTTEGVMEVEDLLTATENAVQSLRTCLSRDNVHGYLPDVKQDLAVVSVEPLHPRPGHLQPYLNS